ncbi:alpha/beta hydrolase [Aridibaculum aurantiacum]|uniref:alpha/beta hydrolase n=1 Tax=Aridibaculum aurantiacum TaxID=2810307 RepID=UPI001A96E786|nr:alpha/beta fold hydrolase [Aridibaculum aurantiacum]
MKLTQRIVLGFYTNKLKLLGLFSPHKAAEEAFRIFCTPYSKRKNYQAPPIFEKANKVNFIFNGETIHGFQWWPAVSNGHKILICHGFDSHSYKFDRYIEPLLEKGFEVLAFDAPAHGLSSGKTINAAMYRDTILEICRRFGPVDGIMAHSLGGLAVALAVEKMPYNLHKRLVLIAPATESTRAIEGFFKYIPVSKRVRAAFDKIIMEMGGYPAEWYSVARVVQHLTTPTLWIHDREDTITPFADMEHLIDLQLPHLNFEITKGLGHSNVYRDNDISEKIIKFLSAIVKEEATH